eukprot:scaffold42802_cov31-Tisochrysis_lutea.AAC.6
MQASPPPWGTAQAAEPLDRQLRAIYVLPQSKNLEGVAQEARGSMRPSKRHRGLEELNTNTERAEEGAADRGAARTCFQARASGWRRHGMDARRGEESAAAAARPRGRSCFSRVS